MAYSAWSVVFGEQPSAAKWNILGTNDAHFYSFLGDNLVWQSWTPTWTNLTIGNGTQDHKYTTIGNLIIFKLELVFGSTTSISGSPEFTLPATQASHYTVAAETPIGTTTYLDVGTANYAGVIDIFSSGKGRLLVDVASGTYTTRGTISSTNPFTWGSGDYISGFGIYEETA
jgi:hypothetical protein